MGGSCASWGLLAELQIAVLMDRSLFDGFEFTFEASQFGCGCAVTFDEERGWPEQDDGDTGCNGVVARLFILSSGALGGAGGHTVGLGAELFTAQTVVLQWQDIGRLNVA